MRLAVLAPALAALLAACAGPAPRSGEDCAMVPLGHFSLHVVRHLPRVTVGLDGADTDLIFDTGATDTILSADAARRLAVAGLAHLSAEGTGIGGKSAMSIAKVDRLELGGLAVRHRLIGVLPFPLADFGPPPADGMLGLDVLSEFDVEVDFATGRGTLYRARACPDGPPDWKLPTQSFPLVPSSGPRLVRIAMRVEGRPVVAALDSGSTLSLITPDVARALGVTDEMLAQDRSVTGHGIATRTTRVPVHRFASMQVGSEVLTAPELGVVALPADTGQVLLGLDYLRHRKLWLAFGSKRLYLSADQP